MAEQIWNLKYPKYFEFHVDHSVMRRKSDKIVAYKLHLNFQWTCYRDQHTQEFIVYQFYKNYLST